MAILWRVSPRRLRVPFQTQQIKPWSTSVLDDLSEEALFGLVFSATSGQGSATSDAAGTVVSQSAPCSTGQGSATSDAVCSITTTAVVDTGQGSHTSDILAQTPFVADVVTGQESQTSDADMAFPPFQLIKAKGFLDNSVLTGRPEMSFWRISQRSVSNLVDVLARSDPGFVSDDVANDNLFTHRDADAFGTPSVVPSPYTLYVSVTGMRDDAFGAHFLENLNKTVYAQRIDPTLAFGAAEVIGPRYISGAAITYDGAIGDHEVIGPRIVYPSGVASGEAFGTDYIAFSTRDVRPSSIQKPSNQVPSVLIGNAARDMDIYGIGNEDVGLGDPIIGEPPFDVIWGAGVGDASEFGEADVDMTGATRRIRPGWPIFNPSIRTLFGTATIIPHTIHPTNVNTPAYGRPTVSNKIRYIDLSIGEKGIAGSRYGTQWISNWIRYIEPAGFDHSEVWWPFGPLPAGELNAVRHVSDGKLYPGSINDGAIGEPSVRINLC